MFRPHFIRPFIFLIYESDGLGLTHKLFLIFFLFFLPENIGFEKQLIKMANKQ